MKKVKDDRDIDFELDMECNPDEPWLIECLGVIGIITLWCLPFILKLFGKC